MARSGSVGYEVVILYLATEPTKGNKIFFNEIIGEAGNTEVGMLSGDTVNLI